MQQERLATMWSEQSKSLGAITPATCAADADGGAPGPSSIAQLGASPSAAGLSTPLPPSADPSSYQNVIVVRPNRRSSPAKRSRTPTRCAGQYMLSSPAVGHERRVPSRPSLQQPYPYEYHAAPSGARSAVALRGPALFGAHQAPPEVLQLWLAPTRRVAPKRSTSSRGASNPLMSC